MTEHEKDMFSRMLGTKELPEKLVNLYEQTKKCADRLVAAPFPPSTLALIAVLSGATKTEVPPITAKPIAWENIDRNTPITTFLDGQAQTGKFLSRAGSKNKGMLRVVLDGDTENFREIAESEVKLKDLG
jgi:hypothetical protein